MIKRKDEIGESVSHNLRGGDGDVILSYFMTQDEAYDTGRMFAKVVLNPGCSIGEHEHHGEFEAYYILSGEGLLKDNGEEYTLYPGDFHQCRDGGSHAFACKGDEPCVFIAMVIFVPEAKA